MTTSCRRAVLLRYFREDVDDDAICQSLGGAMCDNCQKLAVHIPSPAEGDFQIIASATSDLPNHGITKVSNGYM